MIKVITVKSAKIINGIAMVRDYMVFKALDTGSDLRIVHGLDSLIIKHDEIEAKGFRCGNKVIKSKFADAPDYRLIGFKFYKDKPKEAVQNVLKTVAKKKKYKTINLPFKVSILMEQ